MNVLLVNPRNDQDTECARRGLYPPLGMLSVATYARHALGDRLQLKTHDEAGREGLCAAADFSAAGMSGATVVGFYGTSFNYRRTLELAAHAKEAGAVTLLAGPHATSLASTILRNQRCFDFIIGNEGETALVGLLRHLAGDPVRREAVANLVWRAPDGTVQRSPRQIQEDLTALPLIDRSLIHLDHYVDNCRAVYGDGRTRTSIYSSKGCSWRNKTEGGCVFCARLDRGMRYRPISQIWEEIEQLHHGHGIDAIWDISDDNLDSPDRFKAFVAQRPRHCEAVSFFIFSRVGAINEDILPWFRRLNVEEVFLGIESGDNTLLKNACKGQSVNTVRRALELLRKEGIYSLPSFVLGLPGESRTSLDKTLELCREVVEGGNSPHIVASLLIPIPGSPAFHQVVQHMRESGGPDLSTTDLLDLESLERYWADHFTEVGYDRLLEAKAKIDANLPSTSRMPAAGVKSETRPSLTRAAPEPASTPEGAEPEPKDGGRR